MKKQYKLFGDDKSHNKENTKKTEQIKTANSLNLVITDQPDTKSNTVIYKKIQKIETLKNQIQKNEKELQFIKETYYELVTENETHYFKAKEQLIEKLYTHLAAKGFALWQKDILESLINNDLLELSKLGYTSKKLNKITEELMQINGSKIKTEDADLIKEMMSGFFEEMGIDNTDFDFSNFDPNTFKEQMNEEFFKKHAEQEAKHKDENKKEKIKHTDKSFQKLYKNLVKKAHPDLVIDSKEKEIREQWMKELSTAWDERNYYKLLLLQTKIDKDSTQETHIDKKQEKTLIKQLNEEISALEFEKYSIKSNIGENAFYFNNFYSRSQKIIKNKIKEYSLKLEEECNDIQQLIDVQLKTKASTKRYLEAVYDHSNTDYFNPFN